MSQKVLIVEDEPTISRLLSYNFKSAGFIPQTADNGRVALDILLEESFDLVILDLMLPGMHGLEVLKNLRQRDIRTPVIILTAHTDEDGIANGLSNGADDFMTKPFGVAELFARVTAVMRRTKGHVMQEELLLGEKRIRYGDLAIYPERHEIAYRQQSLTLRPKEFQILQYLFKRPGVVVNRDDLMNMVWGYDAELGERTVDVHINALRRKIESFSAVMRIESIRGVGYKLVLNRSVEV